jgi:hypothetical protein
MSTVAFTLPTLSFSAKCANLPTNATNSPPDLPNYKKKANKSSTVKPMKKTVKNDSGEQPIKSSATTDVQYKLVKDLTDHRAPSTST